MDHLQSEAQARFRAGELREYAAPKVFHYGDIRRMTLGGSPGNGDSGPEDMVQKPIGTFYSDYNDIP